NGTAPLCGWRVVELTSHVDRSRWHIDCKMPRPMESDLSMSRRGFLGSMVAGGVVATWPADAQSADAASSGAPPPVRTALTINGHRHELTLDPRVTLLDLLREHLGLTGTKKGCDHGQCGACTVLVNGRRIDACLTLAVAHDGNEVTTIEGLAPDGALHPMQAAFVEHDGLQC